MVEISVVILTLGILFSIIFSVFFGIARITGTESLDSLQNQKALLALENLRSSINQTHFNKAIKRLVFVGKNDGDSEYQNDRLTFASVHSGAELLGVPAVREVTFYLKDGDSGDGSKILMRREDKLVDENPGTGGLHYKLLDNVLSLGFRYSLDGVEWEDTWFHEKLHRVPRLVQIQLKVKISGREELFETLSYVGQYMD